MRELDNYYWQQEEPVKSCLLALRQIILSQDVEITHVWKYKVPFFCYKGRMLCYLWIHKKHKQPYLGIVEGSRLSHPELIAEKRKRIKIMLFDAAKDLPVETLNRLLQQLLGFYKTGVITEK